MASVGSARSWADGAVANQTSPAAQMAPSEVPAIAKRRSAGMTIFGIYRLRALRPHFSSPSRRPRWTRLILALHRPAGWVYSRIFGRARDGDGQYQRQ